MGPDAMSKIIASKWSTIQQSYNTYQIRILDAIRRCRTASLGGSLYKCDHCRSFHKRYHSCRNRHCPQCQNSQTETWINRQQEKLINTRYYHVVFTVPHELNQLFIHYPRQLYSELMRTAWKCLDSFGWNHKYLGAQIGCTMMLHTWGSNLSFHPHVHCIVPGGGVDLLGKWRNIKGKGKFLFPTKALSIVFRAKLIEGLTTFLQTEGMELDQATIRSIKRKPWVVYAKPSFQGPQSVINYLARYASKVAITHHRIRSLSDEKVVFNYTDYRHLNQKKVMSMDTNEFIRRLTLHFLPKGFSRIRHYGIMSSAWTRRIFPKAPTQVLNTAQLWLAKGLDINKCPKCEKGKLIFIQDLDPARGPPSIILNRKKHTVLDS